MIMFCWADIYFQWCIVFRYLLFWVFLTYIWRFCIFSWIMDFALNDYNWLGKYIFLVICHFQVFTLSFRVGFWLTFGLYMRAHVCVCVSVWEREVGMIMSCQRQCILVWQHSWLFFFSSLSLILSSVYLSVINSYLPLHWVWVKEWS